MQGDLLYIHNLSPLSARKYLNSLLIYSSFFGYGLVFVLKVYIFGQKLFSEFLNNLIVFFVPTRVKQKINKNLNKIKFFFLKLNYTLKIQI